MRVGRMAWGAVAGGLGAVCAVAAVSDWALEAALLVAGAHFIVLARATFLELLICLAPIMSYVPISGNVNVSAADTIFPLAVLHALVSRTPDGQGRARWSRSYSFAVIASLGAALLVRSLTSTLIAGSGGVLSVFKWSIVLAYLVWTADASLAALRHGEWRFLRVWSLTASTISAATLLTAVGLAPLARAYGGADSGRFSGSFEDPNLFGTYVLVSLSLVPIAARHARLRWPWLHGALLVGAAVSTASRATYAALVLMALAGLLLTPGVARRLKQALAAGLVVATGIYVAGRAHAGFVEASLDRVARDVGLVETDMRIRLWQFALHQWGENPVLGIGPGQFYYASGELLGTVHGGVVHNTYLESLAETGLVGLLVFLSIWGRVAYRCLGLRRTHPVLSTSLLVGWIGLGFEMCTLSLANARFVWMYLAIALALVQFLHTEDRGQRESHSGAHGSLTARQTRGGSPRVGSTGATGAEVVS